MILKIKTMTIPIRRIRNLTTGSLKALNSLINMIIDFSDDYSFASLKLIPTYVTISSNQNRYRNTFEFNNDELLISRGVENLVNNQELGEYIESDSD